jgi:hypothetical protein
VDIGLPNAWNGIDVSNARHFLVRKVDGTFVRHGIRAGGEGGRIDGVLSNGNTFVRTGFYLPNWVRGENVFPQVIDGYTRVTADLVTVDSGKVSIHDVFGYGQHNGLVVNGGEAYAVNLGTDNLGGDGYTVKVAGGTAAVVNLMRYNGTTSTGAARLDNIMVINIVEYAVTAAAGPAGGGTAALSGNQTRPGVYEQGGTVTATARPAPGYHFVDWTAGGAQVSTDPVYTFAVAGATALTATFAPNRAV